MANGWRHLTFTALLGLLFLLSLPALAAERVALVVGNAAYEQEIAALKNPVNDAAAVAAALRRLGFEVIEGRDLDEDAFYDKIIAFDDAGRAAKMALFFYAGHGLQVDGRNYLAPVDLKLETRQDLRRHAIELAAVLEVMRGETNLVILDACRNNPLAAGLARSLGLSRAVVASRGLARVDSAGGTLIAYATEPGAVAADGTGDHSPYTAALLEHLETPGLSVQDLFTQVTATVLSSTGERQKPWTHSSLSKIVRLVPAGDSEATATVPAPAQASESVSERLTAEQLAAERLAAEGELLFWESVKDSDNPADLQAYLDRYPDGVYAALARNRLQALQGAAAPAASEETAKSVEAALGLGIRERRLIQLGLAAEGFDPGDADGLFGRKTRGAIGRWQSSRGEEATEHLEVESAKLLMASGRKRQAQEQDKARQAAEQRRRELEPGRRFRDCDACPELVVVPSGSFRMGSPPGEVSRYDHEGPQHRVTIAEPFAVGIFEVTFREWDACVSGGGCKGHLPDDEGWGRGDRPVLNVNWDDAQAYAGWLSRETGEGYRLLSESEWEYVARAGTTGPFHTGATISTAQANYDGNHTYGSGRRGVFRERTVPVGSFSPNAFGLHDVHGNVWEWSQDCLNDSYRGAPDDGRSWERGDCSFRVARGGSWLDFPWILRAAYRGMIVSGFRRDNHGFRIARTLAP